MARQSDLRSRSEIEEGHEHRKREMDEQAQDMELTAEDAETVRHATDELKGGGTTEGAEQAEAAMDRAGEATVEVFERQDRELEGVHQESDQDESDLKDRGQSDEDDLSKVDSATAAANNRETADALAQSREMISEDREYLQEMAQREEQTRAESERLEKEYESRVHAARGA